MKKDPTEFRKRFAAWKNGKKPYENGRISDELYIETMEKVARDNWQQWGDESEDASLTRILNDNSYDYRGYYNKYPKGVGNAQSHWTDEFKTVWHPSFSIESKYSGKKSQYNPYGYPGGTWQGEFFTPLWYQQNPNAPGFYKDGYPRIPKYKDGKTVLNNYTNAKFNDDGTFIDDTTRVFDDFYVTPSGVKTKYGSYTDKNWDRYKREQEFFKTHDQQTGKIKYEPGLEIVSPEFDILTLGAGARTNAATQAFLKNRKIANAIAKGIKENAIITGYNRNPVTKELGTLWDYQNYLDNVFPNSKIKDVLWHGSTKKNLLSFSPEYIGSNTPIKNSVGMYLAPEKTTAANYGRKGDIYPVLLNTENPFITNQFFGGFSKNGVNVAKISPKTRSTILANNDAVIAPARGEIAFFEPNNALILGSKRDVEGFKQFINYPNSYKKSLNDVNNVFDIAKEPYMKTSADIAKESSTIRELNRVNEILREFSDDDSRISNAYNNIKTFLQSPAYKKRLEKYYRDKGSSIITQNVAPEDRIGEQLYNMETSKLKIMPKGKLIDEVGNVKDSFGLYDPNSHSIQIASDAMFRLTPEHEMWHAARRARAYLDNAKYKMRVRSLSDLNYYGDISELEVRVLDTLREMQESGLDINNLTDDQIWNFFYETPIDSHGTNVQSLIDNYWYDDVKNAIRNFKGLSIPITMGIGYTKLKPIQTMKSDKNNKN